ncbi:MAG: S8 family serine peptidase [Proteobacteria bacterium]|nr:S8 family serine peptidase [Pseudomonadota bacterium]
MHRPVAHPTLVQRACLAAAGLLLASSGAMAADAPRAVGQLIIKFDSAATERSAGNQLASVAQRHQARLAAAHKLALGAQVFTLERELSPDAAQALAQDISRLPGVAYAEPDLKVQAFAPNDPLWANQWHYHDATAGIRLEAAWAQGAQGQGVVVGVLDTGYRPHADLVANILPGYDFVSNKKKARDGNARDAIALDEGDWTRLYGFIPVSSSWHGTHVAGTVAAVTNNGAGLAGVAPQAKVMPVRVLAKDGGTTSDIADAIIWASGGHVPGIADTATPVKVINMSLGGSGACGTTMQQAIDGAIGRGVVVVVAAGNSSADVSGFQPANCNGVLAIAATGATGGRASYSNFGARIDLAAPGGDNGAPVWSTSNTGKKLPAADTYLGGSYMGTSMAAPHVAGVAALMLGKNPQLSPAQVGTILKNSARAFPAPCSQCGSGLLDAAAAVAATPAP